MPTANATRRGDTGDAAATTFLAARSARWSRYHIPTRARISMAATAATENPARGCAIPHPAAGEDHHGAARRDGEPPQAALPPRPPHERGQQRAEGGAAV